MTTIQDDPAALSDDALVAAIRVQRQRVEGAFNRARTRVATLTLLGRALTGAWQAAAAHSGRMDREPLIAAERRAARLAILRDGTTAADRLESLAATWQAMTGPELWAAEERAKREFDIAQDQRLVPGMAPRR